MGQKSRDKRGRIRDFGAKTTAVQECGVNGGANSPCQLITYHSLLQGPHTSYWWPFPPNPPSPSLPPLSLGTMLRILVPFTSPANSYLSSGLTSSSKAIVSEDFPSSGLRSNPYSVQPHLLCILSHSQIAFRMIWLATVCLDGAVSST